MITSNRLRDKRRSGLLQPATATTPEEIQS